jgi:hypothetical protein
MRRHIPSPSTLSEGGVKLISHWVRDCKANHSGCAIRKASWQPTRLLKIEYTNDRLSLRLIETARVDSCHEPCAYIALSHMWGDISASPPLRTLKANYTTMTEHVNMRDLPLNFVDAVQVCHRVGIKYLWIDSLCIIQDDPKDWEFEAGLMHLVYRNAELTVVA